MATANVVELCGATPLFVDIDPATFNMDAALSGRRLELLDESGEIDTVRAIMPVHTFGNPAGISAVVEVAAEFAIPLVEDAACALGAHENGRAAGSFGAIGCFSFHPRKIITTGEGGMIVTNDQTIADFARTYRNHGQQVVDGTVEFVMAGDNLRLTDLQGAIGVSQMARLVGLVEARTRLAARYDTMLEPIGFVPQRRGDGAAVQSYVVLTPPGVNAGDVISELRARGIEATVGTNAIPFTHFYAQRYGISERELPHTQPSGSRRGHLAVVPSDVGGRPGHRRASGDRDRPGGGPVTSPDWHHLPDNPYNPHAWFVGEPTIGEGCWIGAFTVIDGSGGLSIGRGCDISAGAQIYSHSTVKRVITDRVAEIERSPTRIGDFVHIGAGAVILMGCSIGDHCVIGAGAVVSQYTTVPDWSIVVGVPGVIHEGAARRFAVSPQ